MPRLFQITLQANMGSVGRIAEQIGRRAVARGWDCGMTYSRGFCGESSSTLVGVGSRVSSLQHALMTRLFDRHALHSGAATDRLIRHIENVDPDLIQIHNIHGYWLDIRRLAAFLRGCGKPVVMTLHDCWAFTGHCAFFYDFRKGTDCLRWQSGCHHCPLRTEYPSSLLADRSRRNYELKRSLLTSIPNLTVVAVSEWLASVVGRSFLRDVPVRVIRNGVDLSEFASTVSPPARRHCIEKKGGTRPYVLGVASVWDARKGLEDFVELRRRLDPQTDVVLVGLSTRQIRKMSGIPGRICLGRMAAPVDLAALYSSASLFVTPTYGETLSAVNIEAQACGTPVLTYASGGTTETVLSGQTGEVVERGDVEALAAAARRMLRHRNVYSAEGCRDFVVGRFDARANFDRYVDLYEELLGR